MSIILQIKDLKKYFPITKGVILKKTLGYVKAVDGVSFSIERGETFGLVGESGSGKSTIGRLIVGLLQPTSGSIFFDKVDLTKINKKEFQNIRRRMSMIFQDPFTSLDPRKNVMQIIAEPLIIHTDMEREKREEIVYQLLERVGLRQEDAFKYPHQFSGGQRQRIAIARALTLSPDLIIADEAVSALDVSVQAKIINILMSLQKELNLTYLFIAHDLSVVCHISHKVGVMYLGKLVEVGSKSAIFQDPLHPYTQALLEAVPVPDPNIMVAKGLMVLKGEIPSPINPPSGCRFHPRCPYATKRCTEEEPTLIDNGENHLAACHYTDEIKSKRKIIKQPLKDSA
ncbi:MAG: dipeptide ABC transporter ATP-binding protein [Nitrososphaerales archaeon]